MSGEAEFQLFAAARLQPLYRSAYFLCGDAHAAEDLVQETLARVYAVWGTRRIDNPVGYARTTLTRVFLAGRRRRSSREYPTEDLPETGYVDADVSARLDLQRALDELSPVDRAIVVLRYLEDRPVDEVAAVLRRTPGTVRVRASRALGRLRHLLDETVNDTEPHQEALP